MTYTLRELRYVRFGTQDADSSHQFLTEIVGLENAGKKDDSYYYRSDARAYSVNMVAGVTKPAVAITVERREDLDALEKQLSAHKIASTFGNEAQCSERMVKAYLSCTAPNGILVEFVWRPMTSGWRYFPSRDAGVTEFQTVSLRCKDIAADEYFWTEVLGAKVSDWVGDTAYIRLDDKHHAIALYPSSRNGLMGITFNVEGINNIMQNFYFLQRQQLPIIHGPGHHPASDQIFVTTEAMKIAGQNDEPLMVTFGTGMLTGEENFANPPRQYRQQPRSYCEWGSYTSVPEFAGDNV